MRLGPAILLMAVLSGSISRSVAAEQLSGIVDVKLSQDSKIDGYERIKKWYADKKRYKLYLHVKHGTADKVLTDIILFNHGPGDVATVSTPEGYTNIGHWDTQGSIDAFGTSNTYNSSLCVKYGTENPITVIDVSKSKKGDPFEQRGFWRGDGKGFYLYIQR